MRRSLPRWSRRWLGAVLGAVLVGSLGCAAPPPPPGPWIAPAPNDPAKAFFDANGIAPRILALSSSRVRFAALGSTSEEATPVLFVHGLGGSMANLGDVAARISHTRRVALFDLPGFGGSYSLAQDYSIDAYVHVLKEVAERLEMPKVHLVCHSLGGQVCLGFALDYPLRVASLTLIDAAGIYDRDAFVRETSSRRTPLNIGTPRTDSSLAIALVSGENQPIFKRFIGDHPMLLAAIGSFNGNLRARVRDVAVPTLVIWGTEDPLFPLDNAFFLKENIDGCELHLAEGAGHSPQITQPELVTRWIDAFQERTEPR